MDTSLLSDIGSYLVEVLLAYKGIVGGSLALWFISSVVFKTPWIRSAWKARLETWKRWFDIGVFLLLVVAPFKAWRLQREQLHVQGEALAAAVARVDSLQSVIPNLKSQFVEEAERLSAERRHRIIAGLSRLVRKADSLAAVDHVSISTEDEARWTASARRFLGTSGLDETYLTEFDAAAGPDDERTYSGPGGSYALQKRKAVLVKFLDRLRGTP